MAYLRKEKETIEISYPLDMVWAALPKAISTLQWKIQEKNDDKHHITAKTKGSFMSYGSVILIDLAPLSGEKTKMTIAAETPVTTITSVADFGRTKDRIEAFIEILAKQMNATKTS